MNTKKLDAVVYFLITFFLGVLGVHRFIDGKIGMGVLYLFTGGLFGVGWLVDCIKAFIAIFNQPVNKPVQPLYNPSYFPDNYNPAPPPEPADGEKDFRLPDDFPDGEYPIYAYEKTVCCIDNNVPKLSNCGGKKLDFVQEPENEYDEFAVAIYLDGQKLGYVYRGQTQDMINDWIKKGWYFNGIVNKYSDTKITYKIVLCKPLERLPQRKYKTTTLNGAVAYCKKGDELSFENDYENKQYVILDKDNEEICTNAALYKYTDTNDLFVVCVKVLNASENDSGETVLEYNVYFKKCIWGI